MSRDLTTPDSPLTDSRESESDVRMVCAARLILAMAALLVIYIDPSEPDRLIGITYTALVLYTLYSGVIYLYAVTRSQELPLRALHWFDLTWYVLLIAFSSGTNSIFFFFFFFAILVASFTRGFVSGMIMTFASAVLFSVVGYVVLPAPRKLALNTFLLRPVCLLVLGYLIAYWSGRDIRLRNRLQFLKDITRFSNPRLGVDRTLNSIMSELRAFYKADGCLLIKPREGDPGGACRLHRINRDGEQVSTTSQVVSAETAQIFRWPAPNFAVIYKRNRWSTERILYDLRTNQLSKDGPTSIDATAHTLDTNSFLSVPISYPDGSVGRLYVIGGPHKFVPVDIDFVLQLIDHIGPLMENIRLVDNLASEAAEQERRRIAHDIHDSVIQPYVGLQFGLTAVRQKLEAGDTGVLEDVNELLNLTGGELIELRNYVHELRAGEQRQEILLPALERFAARFSTVTGINVEIEAKGEIPADRIAGELFQLVVEGLSNVRRHSRSDQAKIEIACKDNAILLEIKNNRPGPSGAYGSNGKQSDDLVFTPQSISERAALLGGETQVYTDDQNYTVVSVRIPL